MEQLEILLLLGRDPEKSYSVSQVYDVILSTPQSVEGWLSHMLREGLLAQDTDSGGYLCTANLELFEQIRQLAEWYGAAPVRVIEAIYQRESRAARSFADAFKFRNTDQKP